MESKEVTSSLSGEHTASIHLAASSQEEREREAEEVQRQAKSFTDHFSDRAHSVADALEMVAKGLYGKADGMEEKVAERN